jgi:ankyrin repeat protein
MPIKFISDLPLDVINHDIICLLPFTEAVALSKTSRLFNGGVKYNHNPTLDNQFAIKLAVQKSNLDAIKCLLKVPFVNPSFDDNHAIQAASYKGHLEIVRLLLDNPNTVLNYSASKAIFRALFKSHDEIALLLLSKINIGREYDGAMCRLNLLPVAATRILLKDGFYN